MSSLFWSIHSLTSRSNSLFLALLLVVSTERVPTSISSYLSHLSKVCSAHQILRTLDWIAAHFEPWESIAS